MNEIEYILRILLKARDETAAAFRTAREQLRLFVNAADDGSKKLDKFNASMATMEKNMDGVTRKIREWRAVIQGLGDDNDESAKSIARVGKETDTYIKTTQRAVRTQKDLTVQASKSREEFKKFEDQVKSGTVSNDDAISGYQRLGKELDQVSNKLNIGTRNWQRTREWARIAKENAQQIIAASKAESDAYVENTKRQAAAAEDTARRKKTAYDNALADLKSAVADEIRVTKEGNRVTSQLQRDAEVERRRIVAERARAEATEAAERLKFTQLQESAANRSARAQALLSGRGRADPAALNQLRVLRKEYDELSRHTRSSADEQNHFARESDGVGRRLRQLESDTRKSSTAFERLAKAFHNNRQSIAGFDNSLRSLGILLAVGFAQQLITVLGGLGGQFVAVAASAVEAGAAIGGIFVAGVMQAIPVIGLLGAAFAQVKNVIQAVKQAQLERQQASVQGQAADRRTADAADAVAAANRRLQDAQEGLTKARAKAREDLVDLIATENQAKLAAVGAALSQAEAQQALVKAQATGDVGGIQRAQLGVLQAQADAEDKLRDKTRARKEAEKGRAGGPEGMEGVVQAKQQVADAQRGLEGAKRNAREAAEGTQSAAQKLNFLLAQMTKGQRDLFHALEDLSKVYKETFGPITDIILNSFTRAAKRLTEIIQMPQMVSGARKLATEISTQINRIFDSFTSDKAIAQFLRIANEARRNLKPVTDIIINIGHAFANIGEAGGPAFRKLIAFVGDLADKFLKITENRKGLTDFFLEGEKHFEAWVKLGLSVIKLFLALSGAGGAESGLKSVEDATKAIDGLTKKIDDNREKVGKFFEDARKVTYEVVGVIVTLAEELFKAFKPDRVKNFADLLTNTVIPALGNAIEFMGQITNLLLEFANTKFGGEILKGIVALLIVGKIGMTIFSPFFKVIEKLVGILPKLIPGLEGVSAAIESMGAATILATVGWAILVAAIIAGVIILLNKLGLLDDAWDAIKGGFNAFWKEVEPSIGKLIDAFDNLWDSLSKGEGAFALLRPVLKFIIDIGGAILKVFGRAMGRELGGIIDMIAGVVNLVADLLSGKWGKAWDDAKDIVRGFVRAITAPLRALPELLWALLRRAIRRAASALGDMAESFARWGKRAVSNFMHFLRELPGQIGDFFEKLPGRIRDFGTSLVHALGQIGKNAAKAFVDAFKNVGADIIKGVSKGFKDPGGFAKDVANAFIDLLNALLPNKIAVPGAPDINLPDNPIHHLAGGGPVPGSSRGDTVAALLEPGEHVLTRQEVAALGGHGAVFALRRALGGGGQGYGGRFQAGGAAAGAGSLTISFQGGGLDDFRSTWRDFWNVIVVLARRGANAVEDQFHDMRVNTARDADRMYLRVRGSLADIQHSFRVRSKAMVDNWSDTWHSMMKITYDGLFYIGHEANRALHGFGAKTVNFGLTAPPATGGGKASGGFIQGKGQRGRDMGLYALGAGEAVLNWQHQKYVEPAMHMYYGHGLDDMFARTRSYHAGGPEQTGFASGGRADSHLNRLLAAANRVNAMHLPYVWGGGHQQPAQIGHGMDCSGSVSYVTQQAGYKVPTTTSGSMGSWGFPSGGGGATVFYNPTHTFMRIGSRFWGTSGFGHPGFGGAGWFSVNPGAGYLAGFKQMHLPGIKDVGDFATAIGGDIARLIVRGPASPIKEMIQKAFDTVVDAANNYIGEKSSELSPGSGQNIDVTGVAAGAGNIFHFFKSHGFSDAQAAAFVGNFQQESGLNPAIVQPNGEGHGLAQWGGGRFRALTAFAAQHGKPWTDLGTQLAFVMYELSGSESAAMRAIKGAGTVDEAVNAIGSAYERYGIRGERNAPAHQALREFGGRFAEGGIVPGPDGAPVPILAHAQEWILNKGQVGNLARMIGVSTDALRSMMGFYGGPGGAAGGTAVTETVGDIAFPAGKEIQRIGDRLLVRLVFALRRVGTHIDDMAARAVTSTGAWFQAADQTFTRLDRVADRMSDVSKKIRGRAVSGFIAGLDNLTKENGVLDTLRSSIELASTRLARRRVTARFAVQAGRHIGETAGRDTELERAGIELSDVRSERTPLLRERAEIQKGIDATLAQLRQKQTKTAREQLRTQLNKFRQRFEDADQRVADNIQAIFDAQQAAIQAALDAQQDIVDKITTRFDRAAKVIDWGSRKAAALGQEDVVANLASAQRDLLTQQAAELDARIGPMRALGTKEANAAADQLSDQVNDLRTQVFEMLQQSIADAADRVNAAAQRSMGRLDLAGRMLDALGVLGLGGVAGQFGLSRTQIFAGRADTMRTQQAGLRGALGLAQEQGNVKLIQDLTAQLEELDVTIAENSKALFDARVADVTQRHDYTQSILSLQGQIIDLDGTINGQVDQAAKLANLQATGNDLAVKGQELAALLAEAAPGTQAYQDLYKATLENTVAQKQNTIAVNEATGATQGPQTFSTSAWQWFREAVFSGMGQVLPQYDTSLMTGINTGAMIVPGMTSNQTIGGNVNLTINEAGGPVDVQAVTSAITFMSKTAQ